MYIKFNVVHIVDFIVIAIFTFLFLGGTAWNPTIFMKIVVAFLVGVAFLVLLMQKIIGRILQLLLGSVWAYFIMQLVPFNVWTRDNDIWLTIIDIALFLIFFELHGQGVSTFLEWLEIRRKGMNTLTYLKAHGVTVNNPADPEQMTVQVVNYYLKYLRIQDEYKKLKKEMHEKCHKAINPKIDEMYSTWDTVFSSMGNKLKKADADLLEQFMNMVVQTNAEMKREIFYAQIGNKNTRDTYNHQKTQQESNKQDNEIDKALFNGYEDRESVNKRYHQLVKTFHPDNQNGDTLMTLRIQKTYEAVMKSL